MNLVRKPDKGYSGVNRMTTSIPSRYFAEVKSVQMTVHQNETMQNVEVINGEEFRFCERKHVSPY